MSQNREQPDRKKKKFQHHYKPAIWICTVCNTTNQKSDSYCNHFIYSGNECYNSLYYYQFINNHLFLEKDDSFLKMFYYQEPTRKNSDMS